MCQKLEQPILDVYYHRGDEVRHDGILAMLVKTYFIVCHGGTISRLVLIANRELQSHTEHLFT